MQANKEVIAGRVLSIADPNEADVYLIPLRYKFSLKTELPGEIWLDRYRKICIKEKKLTSLNLTPASLSALSL